MWLTRLLDRLFVIGTLDRDTSIEHFDQDCDYDMD